MIIRAYFSITGLSPTVKIVNAETDAVIVASGAMTALTNLPECYEYDFTAYDELIDYGIKVDGGAAAGGERYQFPRDNGELELLRKKITNTSELDGTTNQYSDYDDDQVTALRTFNFKDVNGNLTNRNVFKKERVW